jgi:hypothetical protein
MTAETSAATESPVAAVAQAAKMALASKDDWASKGMVRQRRPLSAGAVVRVTGSRFDVVTIVIVKLHE